MAEPLATDGPISITLEDGRIVSARCTVIKGLVTVSHVHLGDKTTQVGGSPPKVTAQRLLRDLVNDAKAKGVEEHWYVQPAVPKPQ